LLTLRAFQRGKEKKNKQQKERKEGKKIEFPSTNTVERQIDPSVTTTGSSLMGGEESKRMPRNERSLPYRIILEIPMGENHRVC